MVVSKQFSFSPLQEDDLILVFQWLAQPHVAQWVKESRDWDMFKKKYNTWIVSDDIWQYIVYLEEKPIGYIQYYDVSIGSSPDLKDLPTDIYGMDVWIGDPAYVGKGYGTQLIKQFISEVILPKRPSKIIIDPAVENKRAIHVYEKVGFKKVKKIKTTDGTQLVAAWLMVLEPNELIKDYS